MHSIEEMWELLFMNLTCLKRKPASTYCLVRAGDHPYEHHQLGVRGFGKGVIKSSNITHLHTPPVIFPSLTNCLSSHTFPYLPCSSPLSLPNSLCPPHVKLQIPVFWSVCLPLSVSWFVSIYLSLFLGISHLVPHPCVKRAWGYTNTELPLAYHGQWL